VDESDRPISVEIHGDGGTMGRADAEEGQLDRPCDVIIAPADLRLRAAIALKRQTNHPILLVDDLGRLAGLCDNEEIYRGLLQRADSR